MPDQPLPRRPSPWDPLGAFCCSLIPFLGVPLSSLFLVLNWRRLHPGERSWPLALAVGFFTLSLTLLEHRMTLFRFPPAYLLLGLPVSAGYGLVLTLVQLPAWRAQGAPGRRRLLGVLLLLAGVIYLSLSLAPLAGIDVGVPLSPGAVSRNWAGYQLFTRGIRSVQGRWQVPTVSHQGKASQEEVSVWVGVGGYRPGTVLLQTGTTADVQGGHARYRAFYEVYPGMPERTVFPVRPGDRIEAQVSSLSDSFPGRWQVSLRDLTSGRHLVRSFRLTPARQSAEWIFEAVYLDGNHHVSPLPSFTPVRFTHATAATPRRSGSAGSLGARAVTLLPPGGRRLSPSSLSAGGSAFSVSQG
ncbi:MAG: G1 family endopeptidase [Thermaerobacter sp.]|nr:G1 family endopeptidase [Thermaerobacter sp.]